MLDADVDALLQDLSTDLLVDFNTDGSRSDVPDSSSSAMILLVRHSLVDGSNSNDVDILASFVWRQDGFQVDRATLSKRTSEFLSGAGSVTFGSRHDESLRQRMLMRIRKMTFASRAYPKGNI
jgi:hypothetical protein